jgi:predicted ester cyclase
MQWEKNMPGNPLDDWHAANKASVRRQFEELWNNGRVELIGELFDKDFMNFGKQHQDGHALVKHIVGVWRAAFPDLRFVVDLMAAEGDLVMCEVTCLGTHMGNFQLIPPLQGPSLPPNGKTFKVKHIHRFRLRDGKVVEHFAVRDDLGMFQQLGHLSAIAG